MGFAFSKHDLELMDDPIPDSLYCRPCRDMDSGKPKPHTDMESKGSEDTLSNSAHFDVPDGGEDGVVISEPLRGNGYRGAISLPQQQLEESFNLTHEVDKCDLWKNMVKNLDAPLPSPHAKSKLRFRVGESEEERGRSGENMWMVTEDTDFRALGTLEECDTDLESCPISATWDRGREEEEEEEEKKRGTFMYDSRGVPSMQTSSPTLSSGSLHQGGYEVAGYDKQTVSDVPVLLQFRTTAV